MKIWALELRDGAVRSITPAQVQGSAMYWVHVEASKADPLPDEVLAILNACPVTRHDIMYGYVNPGIEQNHGSLAFSVSCPTRERPTQYIPIGIFLSEKGLATVSPEPCPAIEDVRKTWIDDPRDVGANPPSVLWVLLDTIIDEFYPSLDDIHDRSEALEAKLFQESKMDPAGPLALKRELLILRKRVGPMRDNLNGLLRVGAPLIPTSMSVAYGDLLSHCLRIIENADLGRDIVAALMEAQLAIASNRLNEIIRALTVISTMLMVCSLVAGIYGMNFATMPALHWKYGYAASLTTMAGLCLLVFWLFKRKGWM